MKNLKLLFIGLLSCTFFQINAMEGLKTGEAGTHNGVHDIRTDGKGSVPHAIKHQRGPVNQSGEIFHQVQVEPGTQATGINAEIAHVVKVGVEKGMTSVDSNKKPETLSLFDEGELAKRSAAEAAREAISQKQITSVSDAIDYVSYLIDSLGRLIDSMMGKPSFGKNIDTALISAKNDLTSLNDMLKNLTEPVSSDQITIIKGKAQEVMQQLAQVLKSNNVALNSSFIQLDIESQCCLIFVQRQ